MQLLRENHRYIFTLIHKFNSRDNEDFPMLSEASNLIVITHEALRTHYDVLAMSMRKTLPRIHWLYRYDSRGQLLTAENTLGSAYSVGVGSTNVMQYDAHGNITRFNQGNTTRSNTYVAGTNRLYHNSWLMYNYDTSGRIIGREASMGYESFNYDPYVGKPATVMGQVPVRYGYGGGSQRVLKEVNYTSQNPQKTVYIHGLGD